MRQRSASPLGWALLAVGVVAVFGLGIAFMPRLLAATTYVPPTPTLTLVPPTSEPATATVEVAEEATASDPPTALPTIELSTAPAFSLPGGSGESVSLTDELAEGPVVVIFFPRVGG